MTVRDRDEPQPLAYKRSDAARLLGMSVDSFERFVQSEIKMVRRGSLRLVPRSELTRWLEANAEHVLEETA
jgi:excisionase family DNA binding protein